MRELRPPPGGAVATIGPVSVAFAVALGYFAYRVHYSSANVGSSANARVAE
jgi:hypothetical protein